MTEPTKKTSSLQPILIVAVALLSLGGAYLLFFFTQQAGPWGTANHGEFVSPPTDSAALQIRDQAGAPVGRTEHWWLWVVTDGGCSTDCEHALHQLRQLHILLNRDASRVRRAMVTPFAAPREALRERYPDLVLLTGELNTLASGVYIVDPLGNLVFRYPLQDAGEPVLDDLKRLLKASQIG